MIPIRTCLVFLAVALAGQPVRADLLIQTVTLPPQALPWTATVQVPAFDRSLGTLVSVTFGFQGSISGTIRLENTNSGPVTPQLSPSAVFTGFTYAGHGGPLSGAVTHSASFGQLAAYDGFTDYGGSSGSTQAFGPALGSTVWSESFRPTLDLLCTDAGAGGTFVLTLGMADATSGPSPAGVVSGTTFDAGVEVAMLFGYLPGPARFCDQPAVSLCPCVNYGDVDHGCANSLHPEGGRLDVTGTASIGADTLTLSGSWMTNSSVLYFQGTSYTLAGTAFGDGRRCVTGSVRRLGTKTNVGGASHYPGPGDASVSVAGHVTAPGMRTYQAFYRDVGAFCTPATFNVTNAFFVTWAP